VTERDLGILDGAVLVFDNYHDIAADSALQ